MANERPELSPLFSTKVPPARTGFAVTPMLLKPTLVPETMSTGGGGDEDEDELCLPVEVEMKMKMKMKMKMAHRRPWKCCWSATVDQ
jgi:hypothetical protein